MRFRKLFIIAALSLAASLCQAAPPSEASIETLLEVAKAKALVDTMPARMEQIMQTTVQQVVAKKPHSPEEQRQIEKAMIEKAMSKFMAIVREELSWEMLKPIFIQAYAESFTQEEVDSLIAFYRTPAGAALVEKTPLVMQKTQSLMAARIGPMMEKMTAAIEEAAHESQGKKAPNKK